MVTESVGTDAMGGVSAENRKLFTVMLSPPELSVTGEAAVMTIEPVSPVRRHCARFPAPNWVRQPGAGVVVPAGETVTVPAVVGQGANVPKSIGVQASVAPHACRCVLIAETVRTDKATIRRLCFRLSCVL